MADEIPQSHIKLATTAASGGGEHSPYARRALSAGYKGLIQGTIGGATLYGTFGAVIGTVVGTGLFFATGMNPLAFWAVPIITGLGVYKGADTFGNIGAYAAIAAESSEMNERRGALNERLRETTSQKEADEILKLLHEDTSVQKPAQAIHWRTVLIGAALGAVLLGGLAALIVAVPTLPLHVFAEGIAEFLFVGAEGAAPLLPGLATFGLGGVSALFGAALGGLAGATIGIDRYYIRQWFDGAENIVHDPAKAQAVSIARQQEANRLHDISRTDQPPLHIDPRELAPKAPATNPLNATYRREDDHRPRVRVDAGGAHTERLKSIEEAMQAPTV